MIHKDEYAAIVSGLEANLAAAKADTARLEAEVDYRAKEYQGVLISSQVFRNELAAEAKRLRSAILEEIEHLEAGNDRTHWEGCELSHQRCAAIKRLRAALAADGAPNPELSGRRQALPSSAELGADDRAGKP